MNILNLKTLLSFLYISIFCLIISLFSSDGINSVFLTKLCWFFFILFFPCVFLLNKYPNFSKLIEIQDKNINLVYFYSFFIILPFSPVIQYSIINYEYIGIKDTFTSFILLFIILSIVVSLLPYILINYFFRYLTTIFASSIFFICFSMPTISKFFRWHEEGEFYIQVLWLLCVLIVLTSLFYTSRKLLYFLISCFFLLNISPLLSNILINNNRLIYTANISDYEQKIIDEKKFTIQKPNIFLLVYDGYPNYEMFENYDYNNSDQLEFLKSLNFTIYPNIYSIYPGTKGSIGSMLAMSSLNKDLASRMDLIASKTKLIKILDDLGYNSSIFFPHHYFLKETEKIAFDNHFPNKSDFSGLILLKSIFEGQFRFDAGYQLGEWSDERQGYSNDLMFRNEKLKFLSSYKKDKHFLYSHSSYPGHTQNSGKCLRENEHELWFNRLKIANKEMQDDIKGVVENNKNSIIIIAGDHGPALKNNCSGLGHLDPKNISYDDVWDVMGTFLAIKWPDQYEKKYLKKIITLQDVFPAILSNMFDDPKLFDLLRPKPITIDSTNPNLVIDSGVLKIIDD